MKLDIGMSEDFSLLGGLVKSPQKEPKYTEYVSKKSWKCIRTVNALAAFKVQLTDLGFTLENWA